MARTLSFSDEEIAKMRELRDKATTATELRKALSVLLVTEAGLDASKTSDVLGISASTVFRRTRVGQHGGQQRSAEKLNKLALD